MPSFLVWSVFAASWGFKIFADLAEHLAAHDELGQEVGAFLVALPHHLHGFGGEVQDLLGVFAFGQKVVDDLESFFFLHVGHGFYEFVGHLGSFLGRADLSPYVVRSVDQRLLSPLLRRVSYHSMFHGRMCTDSPCTSWAASMRASAMVG